MAILRAHASFADENVNLMVFIPAPEYDACSMIAVK